VETAGEPGGDPEGVERDQVDDDTILRERPSTLRASGVVGEGPGADLEDTVIGLILPHAPAHDRSVLSSPADELGSGADEPEHSATMWALHIRGTDVTIPLDRPAIIGRHPSTGRIDEVPHPRRVQIPARHRDVSARHARIEQLGDSIVVTDLGSTNGIDVHWSEGSVRRLRPGETSVVLPDAVVALGDVVVVEFVAAATS